MKRIEDADTLILGMNTLFELHEDTHNMKARVVIFNLKGKEYIFWEDVKLVRYNRTDDLSWLEFKRLFKNKNVLERYYENKAKEFYELKMRSM